jgi:hypothetical protein
MARNSATDYRNKHAGEGAVTFNVALESELV